VDHALVAEDAMGYAPIPPHFTRVTTDEVILSAASIPNRYASTAARVRFPADVTEEGLAGRVDAVRGFFAEHEVDEFTWWLGPSTSPSDLRDRLIAMGARPDPDGEHSTAMVLDRDPTLRGTAAGVTVNAVETVEQYQLLLEILLEIDESTPADRRDALLANLEQRWVTYTAQGRAGFIAHLDGRPAAAGQLEFLDERRVLLAGGATRPWARGRGCYAALVAARWDLLRDRSIEAHIVQASDMAMPILARLGFVAVAELSVLADQP